MMKYMTNVKSSDLSQKLWAETHFCYPLVDFDDILNYGDFVGIWQTGQTFPGLPEY